MPRSKEEFEKIRLQSRAKILAAGLELFSQWGYNNCSLASIAKECGISKSTLYHHFKSKEDLLMSILESAYLDWKAKYGVKEEYKNPSQELKRSVLQSLESVKENPQFYRLLQNLQEHLPNTPEVRKRIEQITVAKSADYSTLFQKMGAKDPMLEVMYFGATLGGAIRAYLILGESYPVDYIVNRLLDSYQ
jgi:AcrR family transcriptional regulator